MSTSDPRRSGIFNEETETKEEREKRQTTRKNWGGRGVEKGERVRKKRGKVRRGEKE